MRKSIKGKRKIKIDNFSGLNIEIKGTDKIIKESCERVVDDLKKVQWERNRRTRNYNNGWTNAVVIMQTHTVGTVYNETDWQLTWILENGHFITNKIGGVGWAQPHPHIHPAFEKERDHFEKEMKNSTVLEVHVN